MKQLATEEAALVEQIDQADMLEMTTRWCKTNSGTGNLAGLAETAAMLADAFAALPGEVSLEEPARVTAIAADGSEVERQHGRHLVLRVRPNAGRRILLTGHMDTVFPADDPFQDLAWIDDDTLNGPGAADMKGGIAVILAALKAFETSEAAAHIGYDVMINSDEETGSLSSASLIRKLARGKYAALTYEPSALPDGTFAHARGGSGNYSLTFKGRSAHAGRNPESGRNAIVAASSMVVTLKALEHRDLTINPAKIEGGSANNVVPDHAVLHFNIRPKTREAAERFEADLSELVKATEKELEVAISVHGGITRPPKPVSEQAQRLFDLVGNCCAELGQHYHWQSSGGVCDGNNIAACGIPVVDTMGVRGGKIHS
ncbi:MAG TPA: hydrolase, partial [Sphingomonadaceae bacterium]|nr:hydrolase [Sphingomonadaceae bacterium]